ncbi:MAG: cyclic nucleotide-binding domain-containing protein [Alphaproteobacteria bacterium]|nr:cyclic nucleotide-binding domain-containing protein [Alphaproteobacteria bacterium]MBV8409746.1 cyclic nucleotide-binding domain-containing protein [Alphaproteobacteria bacterium]
MRKVLYILGHLSDEDVDWMARRGRHLDLESDSILVREGVPLDDLFIVTAGRAAVEVNGLGRIASLGAGEIVGEMSFVDSALPSATVRADGRCTLLAIDRREVKARLAEDPGFAGRFYKAMAMFLADRLRGTVDRMKAGPGQALAGQQIMEDELDEDVLDQVSLAGARFERLLHALARSA